MFPAIRNQAKLACLGFAAFLASTALDSGDVWAQVSQPGTRGAPHFNDCRGVINLNTGAMTLFFKESGVGLNVEIDYEGSGQGEALKVCKTGGSKFAKDPKKQQTSGEVTATAMFSSNDNGAVNGTVTLDPPSAQISLVCPRGQALELVKVSWRDLMIWDTTNDVTTGCEPGAITVCIDVDFAKAFPDECRG